MSLRLLFVSSDKFPPFRVDVTELFAKELVALGHTIDWLLHSEKECPRAYVTQWRGSTVYVGATDTGERLWHRIRKHVLSISNDLKVWSLSKKNNYDFILVKDKFVAALIAMLVCKLLGKKYVFWLSYPFPEASLYEARTGTARHPILYAIRGHVFDFILYRLIAKTAAHIFCQSDQMKQDLEARGIDSTMLTPVPMGFASDKFRSLSELNQRTAEEEYDILYLGTLLGARKMEFMVDVLARVRETRPDTRLIYVGDGESPEDSQKIKDRADAAGLADAVTITGFLPQDEALAMVAKAKVCVSPFYPTPILNSTSPTKLIEYMAMNKAVVANDHPEQKLVIAQSRAGLCVAYDKNEFSEALLSLLDNPILRAEMGQRGREYVEQNRTYDKLATVVESSLLALRS